MQLFPHPNDATYKIWSRLANLPQRYSSLKVWMDDRPLVYYKLQFGSGELTSDFIFIWPKNIFYPLKNHVQMKINKLFHWQSIHGFIISKTGMSDIDWLLLWDTWKTHDTAVCTVLPVSELTIRNPLTIPFKVYGNLIQTQIFVTRKGCASLFPCIILCQSRKQPTVYLVNRWIFQEVFLKPILRCLVNH